MHANDLVGQTFGKLTVLRRAPHYNGRVSWVCLCSCFQFKTTDSKSLRTGSVSSCGCARRTHGLSGSLVYKVWASMRDRCNNPLARDFEHYGGRGIKVCKRWDSFELFLRDMGERPPNTSIERRRNDKGYSPNNCYWATGLEQRRNTRHNRKLTAGGRTQLLIDWARELGGCDTLISTRLKLGWSVEAACLTPVGARRN